MVVQSKKIFSRSRFFSPSYFINIAKNILLYLFSSTGYAFSLFQDPLNVNHLAKDARPHYIHEPCSTNLPLHALNLSEVIDYALCHHPKTHDAWTTTRIRTAELGLSRGAYLPSLTVSASLSRSITDNNEINLGNTIRDQYTQHSVGINAQYVLLDFGERKANIESAKEILTAANATMNETIQHVYLEAAQAYYDFFSAKATVLLFQQAESNALKTLHYAKARHTSGFAAQNDILQAQTVYAQATLNRQDAESKAKLQQGTLATAMGLPVTAVFSILPPDSAYEVKKEKTHSTNLNSYPIQSSLAPITPPKTSALPTLPIRNNQKNLPISLNETPFRKALPYYSNDTLNPLPTKNATDNSNPDTELSSLFSTANLERPSLQAARAETRAAAAKLKAINASKWPSIVLNAGISNLKRNTTTPIINTLTGETSANASVIGGAEKTIGLTIQFPLFDQFNRHYQSQIAKNKVEIAQSQEENLSNQVKLEIWKAYLDNKLQLQRIQTTQELYTAAEQNYKVTEERYRIGVGTMLELMTAQTDLNRAKQERIQAYYNWHISRLKLAQSIGKLGLDSI